MPELVRLLDPSELDASEGPHGKLTTSLPAGSLGQEVKVAIPKRLVCARCNGGGCDGCGRSGALRLQLDEDEVNRAFARFVLPEQAGERLRVRLVRPLGPDAGLEQLTIEVHLQPSRPVAALARVGSWELATSGESAPSPSFASMVVAAAIAAAVAIALAHGMR